MRTGIAAVLVIGFLGLPHAHGETPAETALRHSAEAVGNLLPDLEFTGADGSRVRLSDFRGKPLLVTLVYTGCADICPAVIENLAPAVSAAEEALGVGSFSVVTIGFDTRADTPQRMRSFARQHDAGGKNWQFLASDETTVERLANAVGFDYFPASGGFDHLAQVTIVDRNGRVHQQVYGATFAPPQIVEPLKQVVFGREKPIFSLAGLSDRIKLFCTVYNPNTGRYYFNYSLFASIAIGALSLLAVLYVLVRETRKSWKSGQA